MKKLEKKVIERMLKNLVLSILLIIISILMIKKYLNIYEVHISKVKFEKEQIAFYEKNRKTIFSIDKILIFSSANCEKSDINLVNSSIKDLYVYSDIALFINNYVGDEAQSNEISKNEKNKNSYENTVKSLKIKNIKFSQKPEIGEQAFYYRNINNFAKTELDEKIPINNEFEFTISQNENEDLVNPIFYNNCANPITISYVNKKIKESYNISNVKDGISYDGSLIKLCNITLNKLQVAISFDVEVENNQNEKFRTTVFFDIPYSDEQGSIYDGKFLKEINKKYDFYRYE